MGLSELSLCLCCMLLLVFVCLFVALFSTRARERSLYALHMCYVYACISCTQCLGSRYTCIGGSSSFSSSSRRRDLSKVFCTMAYSVVVTARCLLSTHTQTPIHKHKHAHCRCIFHAIQKKTSILKFQAQQILFYVTISRLKPTSFFAAQLSNSSICNIPEHSSKNESLLIVQLNIWVPDPSPSPLLLFTFLSQFAAIFCFSIVFSHRPRSIVIRK